MFVPFRFLYLVAGVILFTVTACFFTAAQDRYITASTALTKNHLFKCSYGGGSAHTDPIISNSDSGGFDFLHGVMGRKGLYPLILMCMGTHCFLLILQCVSCRTDLGRGIESGAQVRVRHGQLFCNNCYSRIRGKQRSTCHLYKRIQFSGCFEYPY